MENEIINDKIINIHSNVVGLVWTVFVFFIWIIIWMYIFADENKSTLKEIKAQQTEIIKLLNNRK